MEVEEFKKMSEETAQELAEVFEELNKSAQAYCDKFAVLCKNATKSLIMSATGRMLHYAEKYTNATFITRWYWRRRLVNLVKAIREIEDQFTKEYGMNEADNGGETKESD